MSHFCHSSLSTKPTDVGDFLPENYEDELEFTTGVVGISGVSGGGGAQKNKPVEPDRPGLNFEDAAMGLTMSDGLEECDVDTQDCIPEGMVFKPASVPDGSIDMQVSITGELPSPARAPFPHNQPPYMGMYAAISSKLTFLNVLSIFLFVFFSPLLH
jgi:hypothetical protein